MKRRSVVWVAVVGLGLLVAACVSRAGSTSTAPLPARTATGVSVPTNAVPLPTRTATGVSIPAGKSELTPTRPAPTEERTVRFTVVYDNNAYDPALRTAWGFACWVAAKGMTVLFDTGADGAVLLSNMAELGLDPEEIDAVVLSHIHGDHTGGLRGLLDTGIKPTVYVPAAFPAAFKADVRARTELVEVAEPIEITGGVRVTGQMGSELVEQALVVDTGVGSVVVTGCAHPGIAEMVGRAKEVVAGEVSLVLGGFHLGNTGWNQIEGIVAELRRLGVQRVAPCHCTGDRARGMFADAYGTDCVLAGAGWTVAVGPAE